MPNLPLVHPEDAPKQAQVVYEEFYRGMSFPAPPNFITTQGHAPLVARATGEGVRNVLVTGNIPRWTKEMIFVAISNERECAYCAAAHLACCRMLGANPETLNRLVSDVGSIDDARLRDTILFALKCAREPRNISEADFEILRRHGLTQAEIMEVIAMSALAVYANILADATAMDQDEMFDTL